MQLLNQCESEGITDIRFVREALHKHIFKPQKIRLIKRKNGTPTCPECGSPMYPVTTDTSIKIIGCGKCRYSEVAK